MSVKRRNLIKYFEIITLKRFRLKDIFDRITANQLL